jgi:hypothetical protein
VDYFFLAVVVIRYETTATARRALLLIVGAFFNDTITVAVWTGFHVRLMGLEQKNLPDLSRRSMEAVTSQSENHIPSILTGVSDRLPEEAARDGHPQ